MKMFFLPIKMTSHALFIGLFIALLTATFKSMDNVTIRHFIPGDDRLTAVFVYLTLGSWFATFSGAVQAKLFWKEEQQGVPASLPVKLLRNDKRMQLHAISAGLFSALSTLFVLLAFQVGEPSSIIALSSAMLVYIGMYDVFTNKDVTLRSVGFPVLAATVGSTLAAYTGSISVTFTSVVLVFFLSNACNAATEILEQRALTTTVTPVSPAVFTFWRLLWFSVSSTVIATTVSAVRGKSSLLYDTFGSVLTSPWTLLFVLATVSLAFFANALKVNMKKTEKISSVLVALSAQIVFAYPIMFVWVVFWPGVFGNISFEPEVWAIRFAGTVLLIWGALKIKWVDHKAKKE